jgi:hypothetical protein
VAKFLTSGVTCRRLYHRLYRSRYLVEIDIEDVTQALELAIASYKDKKLKDAKCGIVDL